MFIITRWLTFLYFLGNMHDTQININLKDINAHTVCEICDLSVNDFQKQFVAPNSVSIAQAHFSKQAWFRAIYADQTPIGFVLIYDDAKTATYDLWRYMIDKKFQNKGFGYRAMALIIEHIKKRPNATVLTTSVLEKDGSPQKFYEKLGFVLTGEYKDNEAIMALTL